MPDAALLLYEREEISVGLIENRDMSWAELARRVGRHPTTIAREVTRNGGRHRYRPATGERRAASGGGSSSVPAPPARDAKPAAGPGHGRVEAGSVTGGDLGRPGGRGRRGHSVCRDHLPGGLHRGVGNQGQRVPADPPSAPPATSTTSRQPSTSVTQHCQPSRGGERPDRARSLGSRPDHRQGQPQFDDVADRTGLPVPDPGHHASRL